MHHKHFIELYLKITSKVQGTSKWKLSSECKLLLMEAIKDLSAIIIAPSEFVILSWKPQLTIAKAQVVANGSYLLSEAWRALNPKPY
jgi:hypothetical protein